MMEKIVSGNSAMEWCDVVWDEYSRGTRPAQGVFRDPLQASIPSFSQILSGNRGSTRRPGTEVREQIDSHAQEVADEADRREAEVPPQHLLRQGSRSEPATPPSTGPGADWWWRSRRAPLLAGRDEKVADCGPCRPAPRPARRVEESRLSGQAHGPPADSSVRGRAGASVAHRRVGPMQRRTPPSADDSRR